MTSWDDLVARVRGLATHLSERPRLIELAGARDLRALGAALEEAFGVPLAANGVDAEALELMVRRIAARHLRILSRWSGDRGRFLAPLFLLEDRRSVRALLRGAAASAPPQERIAGLLPTGLLGEGELEALSAQTTVAGVVALLAAWGHPFGHALLEESRRPQPDLLELEVVLAREWATRALGAAARAPWADGARRELRAFVQHTLDLENAFTAIQLSGQRVRTDAAAFFIDGGRRVGRENFLDAARSSDADGAMVVLRRQLHGTAIAPVFDAVGDHTIEDAALAAELRQASDAARRRPLGIAPILAYFARLRAQVRDLQRIIWRVATGAPALSPDAMVTAR
jgi:vacuolar-type H+-ATPase subunit C/Vma6